MTIHRFQSMGVPLGLGFRACRASGLVFNIEKSSLSERTPGAQKRLTTLETRMSMNVDNLPNASCP